MSEYMKISPFFSILLFSGLIIIIQQAFFYLKLKNIHRVTTITYNLSRFLEIRQVLLEIKDLLQQRYRHLRIEILYLDRHQSLLKWLDNAQWLHFHVDRGGIFLQSCLKNKIIRTRREALKNPLDKEIAEVLSLEAFTLIPFSLSIIKYYSKDFGRLSYICDGSRDNCFHNREEDIFKRYLECRRCDAFSALGVVVIHSKSRPVKGCDIRGIRKIITMPAVAQCLYNASIYEWSRYLSTKDALTGLYNYRGLMENLDREIARASRFNFPLSLLFIDIDDFKELNRIRGHLYGNLFLKRVADRLCMHTGISDFVCRFGGDEFVIVLPGSDRITALNIASRIRKDLYSTINREGCTVSIGVATFPDDGNNVDDLISSADRAIRRAKNAGKNMIVA